MLDLSPMSDEQLRRSLEFAEDDLRSLREKASAGDSRAEAMLMFVDAMADEIATEIDARAFVSELNQIGG